MSQFYIVQASNTPFPLDYRGFKYVYALSSAPLTLTAEDYGSISFAANEWTAIAFPPGTAINIPGQQTTNTVIIQCSDEVIPANAYYQPRLVHDIPLSSGTLTQTTAATFSTGDINCAQYSEIMVDVTISAITGGAAPTATFTVFRKNLDNNYYVLESATPLSAPGTISYNIGAGLDGKSFGGLIKMDMVTTGNPTSVTFSGGIKFKQ